jgi:beta-N-acetylhexosaminidase
MSDDLSMKALDGPLKARAKAALFAGCDVVLHCNGDMDEMKDVASETGILEGATLRRATHALSLLLEPRTFDPAAAEARVAALLEGSV